MNGALVWGDMTAAEIGALRDRGGVAVIPIGAVEQHGPHLPVDMDIRGSREIAREVSRRIEDVVVLPPVSWGLSGAHKEYPGVLSLRPETLLAILRDLCESLVDQGFTKIVVLVGHGPNRPIAELVISEYMVDRGVQILQLNYLALAAESFKRTRRTVAGDFHAGELETSLMLHMAPHLVKDDRPSSVADPKRHFGLSSAKSDAFGSGDAVVAFDMKSNFPEGVVGDASLGTVEQGGEVFESIVEKVCAIVTEYGGRHG